MYCNKQKIRLPIGFEDEASIGGDYTATHSETHRDQATILMGLLFGGWFSEVSDDSVEKIVVFEPVIFSLLDFQPTHHLEGQCSSRVDMYVSGSAVW